MVGIVDLSVPGCTDGSSCTTIPGETDFCRFWSSSTYTSDPSTVGNVDFYWGDVLFSPKATYQNCVRAVRGGS